MSVTVKCPTYTTIYMSCTSFSLGQNEENERELESDRESNRQLVRRGGRGGGGVMACRVRVEPWQHPKKSEYSQRKVLGSGAYGVVYQVEHKQTGKTFALKKISVKVCEEGVPQSVIREISTLVKFRKFRHKNLTKMEDVFHSLESDGTELHISLVVEKCDWDLYQFLRAIPKDMPEPQVRTIARQILTGLAFLHDQSIIHRDLKPQNILINKNLGVKLADFGLARLAASNSSFTTVVVTLWYRSPELLLQTPYGSAVDMWAFGCIVSEMYSRQALFPANTEAEQLRRIIDSLGSPFEIDWPSDAIVPYNSFEPRERRPWTIVNPKLSPSAALLVNRCLLFNPHLRMTANEGLAHTYFSGSYVTGYEKLLEPHPFSYDDRPASPLLGDLKNIQK